MIEWWMHLDTEGCCDTLDVEWSADGLLRGRGPGRLHEDHGSAGLHVDDVTVGSKG